MTGTWGWAGWFAIIAIPLVFWVGIATFMVVLFGGRRDLSDDVETTEAVEPVVEPVRELVSKLAGLSWGPSVPSHH